MARASFQIVATCTAGLEPILEKEIRSLARCSGVEVDEIRPGRQVVSFRGDARTLYAANLHLRTAILVLRPLRSFLARSTDELYRQACAYPWETLLDPSATFAISSSVHSRNFPHSQYATLKLKDAVVDRLRERTGRRPSVDTENPDLQIHLHIHQDQATLSLNSSGAPLFKRGYRTEMHEASINESLAAGLVLLSEWDQRSPFLDPMTGSGTIAIEAALIALQIAPGLFRETFAFQKWPDYDEASWTSLHASAFKTAKRHTAATADAKTDTPRDGSDHASTDDGMAAAPKTSTTIEIVAADSSPVAIDHARINARNAGVETHIRFITKPFDQLEPPFAHGTILMNPPYGERLEKKDIAHFYEILGDTLKQRFDGYTCWILSSNFEALKHVSLHASKKIVIHNGPLECKFQRYDIYRGRKTEPDARPPEDAQP